MRAAVVGAGLAGLVAADELSRGGCEVVVLEARARVGGRVSSARLDNGAVVELGAEYILPGNSEVIQLASRFGLGLWDKGVRYGRREPRGGLGTNPEELDAAAKAIERALAAGAGEDENVPQLLDRLGLAPGAREAILARVEISAATAAHLVAADDLGGVAHIDDEPSPGIAGGNDRLPQALAASLGRAVRLGSPVSAIQWRDGVRLTGPGGQVEADVCVVAVPASVLDRIRFEPALPAPLADALGRVGYGHAAKLFVPVRAPAAPSAVMNVPERYWTWTATGEGGRPQPVVSAFAGSQEALAALNVQAGPETWLRSLARLRGDLELEPAGAALSTWDDDPWVRAAYSTSPPTELERLVAGAAGPLAFAGEHTAGAHHALMEGAVRSGRRAAGSLLRQAA